MWEQPVPPEVCEDVHQSHPCLPDNQYTQSVLGHLLIPYVMRGGTPGTHLDHPDITTPALILFWILLHAGGMCIQIVPCDNKCVTEG